MKNPKEIRKGFGLPEQLAFAAIRAAIRPLLRADSYIAVLVVPEGMDTVPYFRAAHIFVEKKRWDIRGAVVEFDPKRLETSLTAMNEALAEKKAIILFPDRASIPVIARLAADIIVELAPPSIPQMKAVFRWVHGATLRDDQAEVFLALDADLQRAVARPGRSVGRMLSHLTMRAKEFAEEQPPSPPSAPANDDVEFTLETMSGYGEAKDWGLQLAHDFADWKEGVIPWSDVDRGLLLSGPPGVGKTMYAKALSATCGVKLVVASAARWQSKGHLGEMQRAMFRSFEEARKAAPAILFIDEVDSFTDRDHDHGHNSSYVRQVINAFLECLDGTVDRDGVVVVGACNNPAVIDPAVLRPGRLDQHIRLSFPDAADRQGILRLHLRGDLADTDLSQFAEESVGMTGADITQVVRLARRIARRHRRKITVEDILASLPGRIVLSKELRKKVAIHELGHAVIAVATGSRKLWSVSVETRIAADISRRVLGGAVLLSDDGLGWDKQRYLDSICVLLGGIAAEQVFLGQHADGASSDLSSATRLAIVIDRHLGMNGLLHSWPAGPNEQMIDEARRFDTTLMGRVEPILQEQLARAKTIIEGRRRQVERLWLDLVDRGTLAGAEIEESLWVEEKVPLPETPTTRRKIRQRLHG